MTYLPCRLERRVGRAAALLGLVGILVATLTPIPGNAAAAAATPSWCLVCGPLGGVDIALNVILFIPFGLGLRLAGMPFLRVVALSVTLTVFVETMQATVIAGRDPSLSDLLTNTTGGALGAAIASRLRSLLCPGRRTAQGLGLSWAVVWLATMLGSAWLLRPAAPAGPLRTVWGMSIPGYASFTGTVRDATLNGRPLPPGVVPESLGLREGVVTGQVRLGYEAVPGRRSGRWAPVVTLLDRIGRLGGFFESGEALILELPTNADRFRLRNPALRLEGGRPSAGGDPVSVSGGTRDGTYWIAAASEREQRSFELRLSPSFGWGLLMPFHYAFGSDVHLLTALWLAGWLFPLGYWARHAALPGVFPSGATTGGRLRRRAGRRGASGRGSAVVAAGLAVLGVGAIPWLAGYPPVHWSEWIAAAIGLGLGWAAAGRAAYLGRRCASPSASESS